MQKHENLDLIHLKVYKYSFLMSIVIIKMTYL
jgi:hypothetical protein